MRVSTAYSDFGLDYDSVAVDGAGVLHLLSAAGPQTAVKALRACLSGGVKCQLSLRDEIQRGRGLDDPCGRRGWLHYAHVHGAGYRFHAVRLGIDYWHLVAAARDDGLMPYLAEESLRQALRSPKITTPFLNAWVPWLADALATPPGGGDPAPLQLLDGYQTGAALLTVTSEELDALVQRGLREGDIAIPEAEEEAA